MESHPQVGDTIYSPWPEALSLARLNLGYQLLNNGRTLAFSDDAWRWLARELGERYGLIPAPQEPAGPQITLEDAIGRAERQSDLMIELLEQILERLEPRTVTVNVTGSAPTVAEGAPVDPGLGAFAWLDNKHGDTRCRRVTMRANAARCELEAGHDGHHQYPDADWWPIR